MIGLGLFMRVGQRVLGGLSALLKALVARATYSENLNDSQAIIDAIEAAGVLDDATILLTPTATSNALVHCVKDNTSNSDFDFDRASSATRINSNATIEDITSDLARINYDGNGANGHILLEPTSTNLLTYSEDFLHSSGYWNKSNTVIESTAITSPDGNSNTYKLFANTNTTGHFTDYDGYTGAGVGETYTFSLFVKSAGSDFVQIASSSGFPSRYQNFNLSTGALASGDISNATIEAYPNGWYRISVTETTTSTSRRFLIVPALTDMLRNASFTGTVEEDGVYIFGAQLEQLSYPTSYIPTSGSSVTRAAETLTGSGNSTLINSTEGVLYAEIAALANDSKDRRIAVSDGTDANGAIIEYNSTSNVVKGYVITGSTTVAELSYTLSDSTNYSKVALKWKANDFALWVDGTERDTDAAGSVPSASTFTTLDFNDGVDDNFHGKCKCLAVFDVALTDQELTDLTT